MSDVMHVRQAWHPGRGHMASLRASASLRIDLLVVDLPPILIHSPDVIPSTGTCICVTL